MKNKSLVTLLLGVLAMGAMVGCGNNQPKAASYVDATAGSIYGTLSNFSSESVKEGDTLTFTVTPAQYFFIDNVTNNGKSCRLVTMNEDGRAVYSTKITAGTNKLVGSYVVDPNVDFVDEFKLDIKDEVFDLVMSKQEATTGNKTDLDFRRCGIEQVRAPNKWDNHVKKERTSKEVFLNYVDGDTTHVETYNLAYTVKIRYLNIDTPESTSEIEEWGLSASYFSKYIYTGKDEYKSYIQSTTDFTGVQSGMTNIILMSQAMCKNSANVTVEDLKIGTEDVGDYAATTDGNQRNLAYVWYSTKESPRKEDFRCLNLEMVYQGFSFGVGSSEATSPYYYKMFDAANLSAQINGRHLFSDLVDNNYYYYETKGVSTLTLKQLYDSAPTDAVIGYKPESPFCNKKTLYKIHGYVTRKVGTSFYMQDATSYDNDAVVAGTVKPYGIYVFTYSETPIKVGDEVNVVGAISSYGGTFQMQGIRYSTIDPDPVRCTQIVSRNNAITPVRVTGAQFNSLKLPQILVEITDNLWFYPFSSVYQGKAEEIGEGGSEEINKYNDAYPFYNTSNSPIIYASYGETDNAESVNDTESSNIRYTDKVIRFTVDQNVLVKCGADTCYSYRFFGGGSYWYNPAGAEYASEDYIPENCPQGASDKVRALYRATLKEFNRKSCQPSVSGHGLIVVSHGYESTGGNTKMSGTICSGSSKDIVLIELS